MSKNIAQRKIRCERTIGRRVMDVEWKLMWSGPDGSKGDRRRCLRLRVQWTKTYVAKIQTQQKDFREIDTTAALKSSLTLCLGSKKLKVTLFSSVVNFASINLFLVCLRLFLVLDAKYFGFRRREQTKGQHRYCRVRNWLLCWLGVELPWVQVTRPEAKLFRHLGTHLCQFASPPSHRTSQQIWVPTAARGNIQLFGTYIFVKSCTT